MKILCKNGSTVESWYDRSLRQSVIRVIDAKGNQIGDADYCGCRDTAKHARQMAVKNNGGSK